MNCFIFYDHSGSQVENGVGRGGTRMKAGSVRWPLNKRLIVVTVRTSTQ